ncbi:MAG: sulfurtransferase [Candidatus Nitrosocosmicus sp.]|jgi:thiosulfate/3-mercaptopyruvate sulfurtransferase|uniref:sulfurtransferase n=1 Tax=Candidatus Nitrosocosmicus agrestis TaxID=2563600 RepID=UPI00122E7C2D|nr:sulfurtransferase [Candidatus Nitrosocosmicus sp. SS]KAA2280745.1 sulfurtransferase [Candidatus Nitrosocosmicus sp. SS]KAF0868830.1 sulfurtransferase [Candidatus Nitrosocosmicus sp. SS]MDR4492206.1 sulfurtransferase [Candidatus Nitrosocosmicus sp.]
MSSNYAHPEVLVDTNWTSQHLNDPNVRIAEVDYDPTTNYHLGHIPGSVLLDWRKDINDPISRNILSKESCQNLLRSIGVNDDTTLILYGDFNNWFAAFAFWVFKYYGFKDVRIMNGGRRKWLEEDRDLDKTIPKYSPGGFVASDPDNNIRTYLMEVSHSLKDTNKVLVDVRSPAEFSGEVTAPAEYPTEHAQRGGHIPGANNIPWGKAVNEDGTFKSAEELKQLYQEKGIVPEKEVIAYCRIGERSSHTWFVLKYLLGYPNVKNYDGSWTEWGNMIGNPIEK